MRPLILVSRFAAVAALAVLFSAPAALAQDGTWRDASTAAVASELQSLPRSFRAVTFDETRLTARLLTAKTVGTSMALPLPDGTSIQAAVSESSVLDPALQARYPQIKSYTLRGVGVSGRMSVTPHGVNALYFTSGGAVSILPSQIRSGRHAVFYTHDVEIPAGLDLDADTPGAGPANLLTSAPPQIGASLRTYRIAVAVTGELTQSAGGTVADGLAVVNAAVTKLNAIYERDLAVTFVVVASNDAIIFSDGATDPYDVTLINGYDHFVPNRRVMDDNIGAANYDVGHVLGPFVGGGGAATGAVCVNHTDYQPNGAGKADAFSQHILGDPFTELVFPHEMGHISGAPHAWVTIDGGSSFNSLGVEPSAGYSIMSYGHFLSGQRPSGEAFGLQFHALSTQQIDGYLRSGTGSTCGTASATGNDVPVVTPAVSAVTIPAGTPFVLDGSATDGSGTPLTYSWEQMDTYGDGTGAVPLFRSFDPRPTSVRRFPDPLVDYFDETLPTESETYTFRLTARDNAPGNGGVGAADMIVTTDASVGPFVVTFADTPGQRFGFGSPQTVTWDVAGTDAGVAGSATVNVMFSADGGATYPYTLASGVPNDGSESVTFPVAASDGRIRVEAAENVFYNTSEVFAVERFAVASVSPSSVSESVLPDEATTVSLTIANTADAGSSDLTWTARVANASLSTALPGACTEADAVEQVEHTSWAGSAEPGGQVYGQSLTATCAGMLRAIELKHYADAFVGEAWAGVLRVYAGAGNGGTLLSESDVSGVNPEGDTFMRLPLRAPLTVESGQTYSFFFEVTSGRTQFVYHNGGLYAGGDMYETSAAGGPASQYSGFDLAFRASFGEPEGFLLPWPYAGTVAAGTSEPIELTLDATGYGAGTYTADLVLATNDPAMPTLTVPVAMTVGTASASFSVAPAALSAEVETGASATGGLSLTNGSPSGADDLEWSVRVANAQDSSGGQPVGSCTDGQSAGDTSGSVPSGELSPGVRVYGQTVTAPCAGVLSSVALSLVHPFDGAPYDGETWSGTLRVYEGAGMSGAVLSETTFSAVNPVSGSPGTSVPVALAAPVAVAAGQAYSFSLAVTSGRTTLGFSQSNPYGGGLMFEADDVAGTNYRTYGSFDLSFSTTFGGPEGFLRPSAYSGVIAPGGSEALTAAFDATGYGPGTYTADLVFSSNDPARPQVTVPVTMTVVDTSPPPPTLPIFVDADATGANDGTSWTHAFTDLQSALAVATGADQVWIAEGTYRPTSGTARNISFRVTGAQDGLQIYGGFRGTESQLDQRVLSDAHQTVLSGDIGAVGVATDNTAQVVLVDGRSTTSGAVTSATRLDGLVIADGYYNYSLGSGAGLTCLGDNAGCSPTIANVLFRDNAVTNDGGAVRLSSVGVSDLSPSFSNVRFVNNSAGKSGGAMYVVPGRDATWASTFTDVTFGSNTAGTAGGALNIFINGASASSPVFERVTFSNNSATQLGGGVRYESLETSTNTVVFSRATFENNTANIGGGLSYESTRVGSATNDVTLVNVDFVGNAASTRIGGLGLTTRNGNTIDAALTNVVFARNESATLVGAFLAEGAATQVTVSDATFAYNTAPSGSAGFSGNSPGALQIRNSILWGNTSSSGSAYTVVGSTTTVATSLVEGGCPANATCAGVLNVDPQFVDPASNYGLQPTSPASNAGEPTLLPADVTDLDGDGDTAEPLPLDLVGNDRIREGGLDLGAYEGDGTPPPPPALPILFVDADATGANDGTSWTDAFTDLQSALAAATSEDQIWIAEGTYRPTSGTDRRASFEITGALDGVEIYGGFAGTEADLSERVLVDGRETILSGDIGAPGTVSDNSHHVVVIDGRGARDGAVTNATVLDGLLIVDGRADATGSFADGGGLYCNANGASPDGSGCSPTVRNVLFRSNYASGDGGAVYVGGDRSTVVSPTFETVRFENNVAGKGGGAIHFLAYRQSTGNPAFTDVTFDGNTAGGFGGAFNAFIGVGTASAPSFKSVVFRGNSAASGGGFYLATQDGDANMVRPTFENTSFERNTATGRGGGAVVASARVSTSSNNPVFVNTTFVENTAQIAAGLELLTRNGNTMDATLTNVVFAQNEAVQSVGALSVLGPDTDVTVSDATFAYNRTPRNGAAFSVGGPGSLTFANSIFWGNDSRRDIYAISGATPTITTSIVQGGCPTLVTCAGVLDTDPLFAGSQYRLAAGSPALDAGDASLLPADVTDLDTDGNTTEAVPLDLAGGDRVQGGSLDLGAFEGPSVGAPAQVIYVDADATGANDGTSWANAFPDLQSALATATPLHQIWIAEGTYRPTSGTDRRASFEITGALDGLQIYGGFAGTEADLSERMLVDGRETILSGDIGAPGNASDNSHHVVTIDGRGNRAGAVTSATVLDGLVITEGRADGPSTFSNGAGLFCNASSGSFDGSGCSPTVRNAVFRQNTASGDGGAVFVGGDRGTDVSPVFEKVLFENNASAKSGGAVHFLAYRQSTGNPTFTNVAFDGNTATGFGGAFNAFIGVGATSAPTFAGVNFHDNAAATGGGFYLATQDGDASTVRPTFENTSFERNSAVNRGGAAVIYAARVSTTSVSPVFVNTTFVENTAQIAAGLELLTRNGNTMDATLTNVVFAQNEGTRAVGALSVIGPDTDVTVSDATFAYNRAPRGGAAFSVEAPRSLVIANSIFWGNDSRSGVYSIQGPTATPTVSVIEAIMEGGCPLDPRVTCTDVLAADPLFADATYRLSNASPALNAGDASLLPSDVTDLDGDGNTTEPLPQDLGGGDRVQDGSLDLGAFEGSIAGPQLLTLNGPEGWRYLALPYDDLPLGGAGYGFLTNMLTAGYNGADYTSGSVTPTVYIVNEAGSLLPPANQFSVEPGDAMLVYAYEDDDPTTSGVQGGFPKQLEVSGGREVTGNVTLNCASSGASGWYPGCFAGNPYPEAIDWDDPSWTKTDVEDVIYIIQADASFISWNGTTGDIAGGVIPAGQGFYVGNSGTNPTLVVTEQAKTGSPGTIYGDPAMTSLLAATKAADDETPRGLAFRLAGAVGGADRTATAYVSLGEGDALGLDRHDARSLTLADTRDALRLYTLIPEGHEGAGEALAIGSVPSDLGGPVEIPLHAEALAGGSAVGTDATLEWDAADLPDGWTATLLDRQSGERYDLTEAGTLALEIVENDAMAVSDAPQSTSAAKGAARRGEARSLPTSPVPYALRAQPDAARFTLVLSPGTTTAKPTFELAFGEAFPNPARDAARFGLTLPTEGEVTVEVFDALGRKVATMVDAYAEGPHQVAIPVSGLAAGSYVLRIEAAGESVTRRLTVVR